MVNNKVVGKLKRFARDNNISDQIAESTVTSLDVLLKHLGDQSQSQLMQKRIGQILMRGNVSIVAPSCPDYTHQDGVYTFRGLGNGVPLLAQHQIKILQVIQDILPEAEISIVVADQERYDAALRNRVGLSEEEFLSRVDSSIASIITEVQPEWNVLRMTERFPRLVSLEQQIAAEIASSDKYRARIQSDTLSRAAMYRKIGVVDADTMMARTVRTAAQYAALAEISASEDVLNCNHQTVNLSWFKEGGAAVLHNPVSIY